MMEQLRQSGEHFIAFPLSSERETTPLEREMLHQLKRIFSNCQLVELQRVAKSADNLNEAIGSLLVDRDCREDVSDKKQVYNLNLSDFKEQVSSSALI